MKKILVLIILLIIAFFLSRVFIVNKNNKYNNNKIKEIIANYKIEDKINYYNEYNDYYIIMTNSYIIVLNNKYVEILKDNIDKLFLINDYSDIIYKRNTLMYEVKKINNKNIKYEYYDIYTGELLDTYLIGG